MNCISPEKLHSLRSVLMTVGLLTALAVVQGCATVGQTEQAHVKIDVQDDIGFTITEAAGIGGNVQERYQAAHSLLAQQQFAKAAVILEQLVVEEPQLSAPQIDLGITYHLLGDLEAAEKHLVEAVAQNPSHPIALNELGIVYRKQGQFINARESYERALAVYPSLHSARRNLGVLCDLYLGDLACALENYEAYMQTVTEDPEVSIWIADLQNRFSN